MVSDHGIDFLAYLQSLCQDETYSDWQKFYTTTDTLDHQRLELNKSPKRLDLSLMVQTVQSKQPTEVPERETIERLNVLEGLRKYAANHVMLVGRPGSGKSTALEHLLWEEAEKCRGAWEQRSRREGEKLARIPVLVELRQYKTSVLDLIREFLKRHRLLLDETTIETLLFQGRFLLLVDGVNELPDEDARRNLRFFRQNNPNTPMIFTTRDLGVGDDLGIEKKLKMQPLSEGQMQQFVCAYLLHKGEEMLRQLGGRLREFGETPLLLWMLCELFRQTGNIPPNLGLVFRCFVQSYNAKFWDNVRVCHEFRHLLPELLQHLAFTMMQAASPTELRVNIDKREAELILTKFLEGKVDYPPIRAKAWLENLLKHHLIQLASNSQIEFRHQLLQEYYAAECLLQQFGNINDDKLKRDYLNYLKWTEPLALMLLLVEDEAQAVRVVKLALDVDLKLGARLAGEVKPEFQEETVGLVNGLEVPQELKIRLLGITRSNNAIPALLPVLNLNDENSSVAWYAADSLGNICSAESVSALLPGLIHEYAHVRRNSAYALGKISSEAAVSALVTALNHEYSDVPKNAAYGLGEIGNKAAITKLLEALEDEESSVRQEAATALGKIGSDLAIPGLLKALKDESFSVSHSAAFALGEISSALAVPEILEALKNKAMWLRERAIYFTGKIENQEYLFDIMQTLENENHSFLNAITWALNKIGGELIVPTLLQYLKDEYFLVRANAAYALGETGTKEILPALLKTLKDENFQVREKSAYALGKISDEAALPALLEALQDEVPWVRAYAASALGEIGNDKAVPALLEALKDKYSLVRGNAVYALGKIGSENAVIGVISALGDRDPSVRRSAVLELGEICSENAVIKLLSALKDTDIWVRAYAAEVLGKIGTEAAIKGLLAALKDKNPSVCRGATRGLEQIKINIEVAVADLLPALKAKDSYVRQDAAYALGKIAPFQILPNLIELLKETEETYLLNTITAIQKRCNFYNYAIATSLHEEEIQSDPLLITLNKLNQTMSETPKVQMNFNAPITGSSVAGNVEGNSIGTHNKNVTIQNIAEVEKLLQQLLEQIEQTKPTPIEAQVIVDQAVEKHPVLKDRQIIEQAIKHYPPLKIRLQRVVTAVGIEIVKIIFAPAGIAIEAIRAWNQPE
ncbi:HEAT repeat domain-containing protein [Nostoc sp. PA-18-2419]|uniref:HEAT repeat domain-containing protein n=1 Tax=Nostoc sp. PA-18-2419 TaxID=2575443 RepID=UPI00110A0415|nr:HEAT repeat domain-containing protein [Nostoc sp. PA-18-2419]